MTELAHRLDGDWLDGDWLHGESLDGESLDGRDGETSAADLVFLPTDDEGGWQDRALCAQTDPEAFFPEKGGSTREAKRICVGCQVRAECLEYALVNDERFGIWGGLSERERQRLRRAAG
jgi:WhiB family transcriptional regulator, redox-sensing transcriptional regulator